MRRARRYRLLWLICLCLAPRPALADAAQARVHFDRGRTYFEVNEYRRAIAEFKAAHLEKADPAFLYNIAECYRRLGEGSEALQFYRRFLDTAPADDKTRPVVEQHINELKAVADDSKPAPTDGNAGGGDALAALNAPAPRGEPAVTLVETPTPAPSAQPSPFYTRAWFLVTVGVVVVASAVGV
jgi:tetratricopeptide (TPR) repeat protein